MSIPWFLVGLGLLIALGLGSLIVRDRGSDGRRREVSFYTDLTALVATSLLVGMLALTTLTSPPQPTPVPRSLQARAANPSALPTSRPTLPPPPTATPTATDTATPAPPATVTYTVKPGDTLSFIAQLHNVSIDAIVRVNKLPSAHELQVGQVLVIPVHGREATPPAALAGNKVHIVQSGEVLSEIARRYGVDMQAIMAANDLPNANSLRVGQELIIPVVTPTAVLPTVTNPSLPMATSTVVPASPTQPATTPVGRPQLSPTSAPVDTGVHIVQAGDTLVGIASRYGITTDALKAANPGVDPRSLQIGQRLVIPANRASLPPAPPPEPPATPVPTTKYPAPRLVSPPAEASFGGVNQEIVLQWEWDGQLGPDEWFDVQMAEKEEEFQGKTWTKETHWRLPRDMYDRRWRWRIIVIRGVPGQSREELSLSSEIRHIDWH